MRLFGCYQPGGDCLGDQLLAVDALAVVDDADADFAAGLARSDGQRADLALACGEALCGRLDTVVDGVADDVDHRVAHHLDHLAVDFDVAALDLDHDLLAELVAEIADHARKAGEQCVDPLHADAGDRLAEIDEDCGEAIERRFEAGLAFGLGEAASEVVARHRHVRHPAHDAVEQVDRKADGARCDGLALGLGRSTGAIGPGFGRSRVGAFGQRGNQRLVVVARKLGALADGVDHLGDAVDHGEHGADQGRVGACGGRRGNRPAHPRPHG